MTPSTHLEIETKLDAAPDVRLPDLSSVPGVVLVEPAEVQELSATYFDSADLRLIRNRITLRRRTGGDDAGWHLKLPNERGARMEVHLPLGDSRQDVPEQLLALLRSRLRGAPVAPVARISTRRTLLRLLGGEGELLAEVADDLVTAEALGDEVTVSAWREIEVELAGGDNDLLAAAVGAITAAGAHVSESASKLGRTLERRLERSAPPPAPPERDAPTAADVVLDHLRVHASALSAQDPRVRLDKEDAVHQMRVASRRLRSALATFRRLFEPGAGDALRDELQWLGGVLGAARDAEVQHQELRAAVDAQPPDLVLGPVLRRIDLEMDQLYRQAHATAVETLDGARYLALLDALDRFVTEPPLSEVAGRPARKVLSTAVRKAEQRVQRAVARASEHPSGTHDHDVELHEVRKAAKRARYAAEAVEPVFGEQASKLAKAAQAVQDALGAHQDTVLLRERLLALGVIAHQAGENAFTFGRLHALAEGRAALDEEEYERAWQTLRRRAEAWLG